MVSKWAGIAVVAVMACGWASTSKAAYLDVSAAEPLDNGEIALTISLNTSNYTGYFDFLFSNETMIGNQAGYEISGFGKLVNFVFIVNEVGYGFSGTIDSPTATFRYFDGDLDGPDAYMTVNYSQDFIFSYDRSINFTTLNSIPIIGYVPIDPVAFVPLPGSAPLFGAALLGLAGLGYDLKRRSLTLAS